MRILHAATELFPLLKVGGLGDVLGALPQAQAALGAEVRVVVPGFPAFRAVAERDMGRLEGLPGGLAATLRLGRTPAGVPLYVVDLPSLFERPGNPYEERGDSALRFAAFAAAAARLAQVGDGRGWRPDLLHAHDWQAALAPLYLAFSEGARPATVLGIHNIAYQGLYGAELRASLGLPAASFHMDGVEFYGMLNFLKGGLAYADRLVTVSPTYAGEIRQPGGGFGLEGLLARRSAELVGILNGADYGVWNPARSPHLPFHYDAARPSGKCICKNALQRELGLAEEPDAPLCVVVSRLAPQKALDLVLENVAHLVSLGAQLALLGSGDAELARGFAAAAEAHPGRVAVRLAYDEGLAHRFLAGGDLLLMPSRQEPCGLTQLYALRYGALPLVRRTGGLADTVVDAEDPEGTGFVFEADSAEALGETLARACRLYREAPRAWKALRRRAMTRVFDWKASAGRYLDLYRSLVP